MTEALLVRSIVSLLRQHGHATKVNTGAFGHVGTPDIVACVRGRTVVVEAKGQGGKLTPAQSEQLRRWAEAGALALVVTTVDEVEASLRAAELIH